MKKLIALSCLLAALVGISAQESRRFFELGVDVEAGFANNYLGWNDIFTETIVIDLNQMNSDLGKMGFMVGLGMGADTYMNLTIPKKFSIGFNTGVSASGGITVPGSLFELLAEGNDPDKTYAGKLDVNADVYGFTDISIGLKAGPIWLTVTPAFYMPLLYIPDPDVTYSFVTSSDGTLRATAVADMAMYSVLDLEAIIEKTGANPAAGLGSGGGIDLSLGATYALLNNLDLGATFTSVPLLPASLANRTKFTARYSVDMEQVLKNMDNPVQTTETSDYSYDKEKILILRPFKFGLNANWRPFNRKILSFRPDLALGVYDGVFFDAGLNTRVNLANILIFDLDTGYRDRMWRHRIGMILNFRITETEIGFSSQSQAFTKSFGFSGMNLFVGMRMGF